MVMERRSSVLPAFKVMSMIVHVIFDIYIILPLYAAALGCVSCVRVRVSRSSDATPKEFLVGSSELFYCKVILRLLGIVFVFYVTARRALSTYFGSLAVTTGIHRLLSSERICSLHQ